VLVYKWFKKNIFFLLKPKFLLIRGSIPSILFFPGEDGRKGKIKNSASCQEG
jgi:hypothetical protein